jgi:integrase/recombinase XerD
MKAGKVGSADLSPHDLRNHAAGDYQQSSPAERHSNFPTTQRYLGKVSDIEAMRWINNIHG